VLVAAGAAFGVTRVVRTSVSADARIPAPPAANAHFVEDDDGAGADQQGFILKTSPHGLVSIRSERGGSLGSGVIITRSGFVLASYRGLEGAGTLTARVMLSGRSYTARLVGSDPVANLALLQLSRSGFSPAVIGTTTGLRLWDRVASGGTDAKTGGLVLSNGAITGINIPAPSAVSG
jgi:S1-C subfamily serine protease